MPVTATLSRKFYEKFWDELTPARLGQPAASSQPISYTPPHCRQRIAAPGVRRARARQILILQGSGAWHGDLSVVREDTPVYRTGRRGAR